MDKLIAAFPGNILDALAIAEKTVLKPLKSNITNVVICGMGGSGIGGKMVAIWLQKELPVPVVSHHDYTAPHFINENSLVIASSYSGNTEETLICVEQAREKGANIIGICSGGELYDFCIKHNFDVVKVPGGNPPRTALAFSVVQVTNIFVKLGMASPERLVELRKAYELIVEENDAIKEGAKELADFIGSKTPVFYSAAKYEGVAVRAKQQFNENAKNLCWYHVLPEMNHNELVGWGGGDQRFAPVYFDTEDLIARNQKRVEISMEIIEGKSPVKVVKAKGKSLIEKSIYLIHLIDWSSFYLSEVKKVDPIEIKVIDHLKSELANFKEQ